MPVEWVDEELLAVIGDLLNRQADRRNRHVDNQVDVIDVVPLSCNARTGIGLDLVVGGNHCGRLAQDLAAEILDRHLRRRDRAGTGRRCRGPGEIGQHADLHHIIGDLRVSNAAGNDEQSYKAGKPYPMHDDPLILRI